MSTKRKKTRRYIDDQEILKSLVEFALRTREQSIFSGHTTDLIFGSRTEEGGKRKYQFKDDRGNEEQFERTITTPVCNDAQSFDFIEQQEASVRSDSRPVALRVIDAALDAELRLEALREWIADDVQAAASYLFTELKRTDLEPAWRRIVIYAVDSVRFEDPAIRSSVANLLLFHANELRRSNLSDDLPAAMCAIRRAGSILPEERADELLPFLKREGFVDTRLVALQAVSAIYSSVPPNRDLSSTANRAGGLAIKHWDLDVFQAGDISALAIEATVVAAMLGCGQMSEIVEKANEVGRRLLMKRLKAKLEAIASTWSSKSASTEQAARLREIAGKLLAD